MTAPNNAATPAKQEPPKQEEPKEPEGLKFEKPEVVKGIYLTAWSAVSKNKMAKMLDLLDKTELNAVVIDVRDSGNMYWKSDIELAKCSPKDQLAVTDGKVVMERLAKHKVYPIARIACFRDNHVPKKHPELAVKTPDGRIWKDRAGNSWLDPYNKKNWEYLAETVEFALDQGFPEIQLDYVRFPSEGKIATQTFPAKKSYSDENAKPEDVIAAFAKYIGEKVRARGAVFSADIFGIISSNKGDEGIGQMLEKIAEPFDLICPMVYPSHYAMGEYGVKNPNAQPYDILKKSLADYKKRLPNAKVRPWLQDFSLGVRYGVKEVQAQIKAAKEHGYDEFLLWNPRNNYTAGALKKESAVAKKPEVKRDMSEPQPQDTGKP